MKLRFLQKTIFQILFLGLALVLPALAAPPTLKVSGNQLLAGGCNVFLKGVDVDSMEWYDGNGDPGEGPPNGSGGSILETAQMAVTGWHCSIIRLPLNQDFWFGCGGAGAATYQATVASIVNYYSSQNAYVILDLHWSGESSTATAPCGTGWGNDATTKQQPMADANGVTFWSSVAGTYANNPAVVFDLYNEPFDKNMDNPPVTDTTGYNTWLNGGTLSGASFSTPGMQALLNAVRATGADNVCLMGGLHWCANLNGLPAASVTNTGNGVVFAAHIYGTNDGDSPVSWNADIPSSLLASYPVFAGEYGPDATCPPAAGDMTNFDGNWFTWVTGTSGLVGASAWSMTTDSCPSLLSSYNPITPNSWGAAVTAFLASPTPTCSSGGSTNTPTRTPTNTATLTPTSTATNSATRTATATTTYSPTLTPTATATKTATATASSTPTNSPTRTPSFTPTNSFVFTATTTPTSTASYTPSSTDTPTATGTPTRTSTSTPSPTPTSTSTSTPTATVTSTNTKTATSTPTNSATATATLTPTGTASSTVTHTATPTSTDTQTNSPTGTLSPTLSPTPSNTPTVTASHTPTGTFSSTATASATSTPSSTPSHTPSATASSTPTLTTTVTPTPSPTPVTVQAAPGANPPPNSSQPPGASNVMVQQVQLTNPGGNIVTLSSLTLTESENSPSVITSISLLKNGVVVTTAGFTGTTLTFNFTDTIPANGGAVTYQVAVNFSNTAPVGGTYQFSLTGGTGTNGQPVLFSNLPVAGATITIVAMTPTPSNTPTNTTTPSPSPTNSPVATATTTATPAAAGITISFPYPNPSYGDGPVAVNIQVPGPVSVNWSVFTTAFRKVNSGTAVLDAAGTFQWDLKDKTEKPVANGLYYLRLEVSGNFGTVKKIFKILIL